MVRTISQVCWFWPKASFLLWPRPTWSSVYNPGWTWTHRNPPAVASCVLGLQSWAPRPVQLDRYFLIVLGDLNPIWGLSSLSSSNCCHVYFSHQPVSLPAVSSGVVLFYPSPSHGMRVFSVMPLDLWGSLCRGQYHHFICSAGLLFSTCVPLGPVTGVEVPSPAFLAERWPCLGGSGLPPPWFQHLLVCFMAFIYLALWVRVCF